MFARWMPVAITLILTSTLPAQTWETLFDGTSTSAWRGYKQEGFPAQGWTIEDGCLHHIAKGGGGDIITREMYSNFELQFEWKVAQGANSGVMYRVTEEGEASYRTGPEFQVLDDSNHEDADPKHKAGALYDLIAGTGKVLAPTGQFNRGRIQILNGRIQHWVNDVMVLSFEINSDETKAMIANSKFKDMPGFMVNERGHICLQDHGDAVWYRNIRILRFSDGSRTQLFNGKDLSGWIYHLQGDAKMEDVWSVSDGTIVCKGVPAGYLRTEAKYRDFLLKVQWRWSPVTKKEGNSGVLFRMTGEDKVWPRSIEAQLMSKNAGDFWNIGDFPMRVEPRRTRGRNTKKLVMAENPVGEWNTYEILVLGGEVDVRVNGRVVNRAWDAEWIAGHICLQSEGAEIHFQNIELNLLQN